MMMMVVLFPVAVLLAERQTEESSGESGSDYCFYSYVHVFSVQPPLMCADVLPCGEDVVSGRPDGAVLLYSDCLIPQSVSKTEISEIPV